MTHLRSDLINGRSGCVIAFLWGWAEATFFILIPDIWLSGVCLLGFRKGLRHLGWVLLGSLSGGWMMYLWSAHSPDPAKEFVMNLPFVTLGMQEKVVRWLETSGALGLSMGPLSGIPYKLFAVESPALISLPAFMLFSIPARLSRLVGSVLLFGCIGRLFKRRIQTYPKVTVMILIGYWVVMYAWYWSKTGAV